MSSPPKIIRIDASSLANLHCFRRFYKSIILGYVPKEGILLNDIEYGSAWHIFRESLITQRDEALAITKATKYFLQKKKEGMIFKAKAEYLNEGHLAMLCMKYIEQFGYEKSWGRYSLLKDPQTNMPLIEQNFSIPFYKSALVEIMLQGTLDELVQHPAGYNILGDDKTTRSWNIKKYLKEYNLKPQLLFYRCMLDYLSEQEGGDFYKELLKTRLGCRINGIFLKEAISECQFEQSEVFFFSQEQLDEFKFNLKQLCEKIERFVFNNIDLPTREGMFNGTCSGNFGDCEFSSCCAASREEVASSLLNNYFIQREYKPLEFRKQLVSMEATGE